MGILIWLIGIVLNIVTLIIVKIEFKGNKMTYGWIAFVIFGIAVPYSTAFIYFIVFDPFKIGQRLEGFMDKEVKGRKL